jgi:hypothetical protein
VTSSIVRVLAQLVLVATLGIALLVENTTRAFGAGAYDDCAVRLLAGHTYIFISLDNPTPAGVQQLWSTCSELAQGGYAVSIPTSTPMSGASNQLVCSYDSGPAHMHVWAAPDAVSRTVATSVCEQTPGDEVTWWPLL